MENKPKAIPPKNEKIVRRSHFSIWATKEEKELLNLIRPLLRHLKLFVPLFTPNIVTNHNFSPLFFDPCKKANQLHFKKADRITYSLIVAIRLTESVVVEQLQISNLIR
jgi:hypothetical protein